MNQVTISNKGTISAAMRHWYLCQVVLWGISLLALELVLMARGLCYSYEGNYI
jgi:hypothetical protein